MSLDNISHLGSTGHDELVPSRYAVQVGDIDVLVISDGVLPITAPTMAHNADTTDLAAWLDDMFLPPDVLDWPLNVAVVRSGGKTILIDAGLGLEFPDFPRAGQLALRLEAAGIDPASVTDVVLTHLHMDHIGGLLVDGLQGPVASGPAGAPGGRRGRVLGGARFLPHRHAGAGAGRAPVDRLAVPRGVPRPTAAVRDGVRGGAGSGRRLAPAVTRPGTASSASRPAARH